MREVNVASFSGPLDLLLQLIEQQELDISQISLATVTEQYIAALQKMEELPVDELADFLVVAAKLLLIKSRLLVPGDQTDEGEDVGLDLERQLKMYQQFVEASRTIAKLWNKHRPVYPREGSALITPIFHPPEHLTPNDLQDLMHSVLKDLEPITRLPQTVLVRTINIRQKIAQIRDQLVTQPKTSFHQLLQKAESKTEVIVTFLAVLELVKLRSVSVNQEVAHGDVSIELVSLEQPLTMDIASV